jgi:5-(carboxyamino)imidazole ribonucleotide mutase
MPGGVPVATMAINGGRNAGLFAARILASGNPELLQKITAFQTRLAAESKAKNRKLQAATQSYSQP